VVSWEFSIDGSHPLKKITLSNSISENRIKLNPKIDSRIILTFFLGLTQITHTYTANVLSVEIADVYLRSQSKNKYLLILQIFKCDWLQISLCCFQVISKADFSEKKLLCVHTTHLCQWFPKTFFIISKFSQFFCWIL